MVDSFDSSGPGQFLVSPGVSWCLLVNSAGIKLPREGLNKSRPSR